MKTQKCLFDYSNQTIRVTPLSITPEDKITHGEPLPIEGRETFLVEVPLIEESVYWFHTEGAWKSGGTFIHNGASYVKNGELVDFNFPIDGPTEKNLYELKLQLMRHNRFNQGRIIVACGQGQHDPFVRFVDAPEGCENTFLFSDHIVSFSLEEQRMPKEVIQRLLNSRNGVAEQELYDCWISTSLGLVFLTEDEVRELATFIGGKSERLVLGAAGIRSGVRYFRSREPYWGLESPNDVRNCWTAPKRCVLVRFGTLGEIEAWLHESPCADHKRTRELGMDFTGFIASGATFDDHLDSNAPKLWETIE